jgi:methyl-accepting chemotaxis protein
MANEATKKDLADLEKRLNTKVQNLVDSTNKAFEQETNDINKSIEALNKAIELYNKAITEIRKSIDDIRTVVNQHAKVINQLEK